jgi:phage terminase small subunit
LSMSKPLTAKREAFVLAYIKTGNASEAYRQAYNTNASAKTIHEKASRLLAEGNVRARFEVLRGKVMERAVEKTAISKAGVIEKLVANVERAMQAEPVRRKTDEGKEQVPGEYTYNGSVANKALELLGKELGMFIDRKEIGGPNEFDRMSDEELEAFLREPIETLSLLSNGRSKQ